MTNLSIKFSDRTGSRTITGTIEKIIIYPNGMFGVFSPCLDREWKYETTPSTEITIEPLPFEGDINYSF